MARILKYGTLRMKLFATLAAFFALGIPAIAHADLSGQGIPRVSAEECTTAAKRIATKLESQGFTEIQSGCVGTNEDIGSFIPVVRAKHAEDFAVELAIRPRRAEPESCLADLEEMRAPLRSEDILEAECAKGTQYNEVGESETFHQAWLTKITPLFEEFDEEALDEAQISN